MDFKKAFSTFNASTSAEPGLKNYFVSSKSIRDIKTNPAVSIISGLKGIGKTATFRDLTEFDKNSDIIVKISADHYTVALSSTELRSITYSHEFEYELAIEILTQFDNSNELHSRVDKKLISKVKKQVSQFNKLIKEYGGRIKGFNILGVGLTLSDPTQTLTGLQGRQAQEEVISLLKELCDAGIKMRIVIDDPEEVFFTDKNINIEVLGGLWIAVTKLNTISTNLRAFLLMKTHVFDMVYSNTAELDKYPNSFRSICWNVGDLLQVIESRTIYFLKTSKSDWQAHLFGQIKQNKIDEIFNYIFSNLRNGPRELLSWFYYASEYGESNGLHFLTLECFEKTVENLSRNAFNFFHASNQEEFPEIGDFVRIVFDKVKDKVVTKSEFTETIKKLQMESQEYQSLMKSNSWIQSTVSHRISELLFRVGVLNLVDAKGEIYPYMCNYNQDNFQKYKQFKLTSLFMYYLLH